MQDDPIFKDRLERAEVRINENLSRYVEAHDHERQGGEKRARVEALELIREMLKVTKTWDFLRPLLRPCLLPCPLRRQPP
jgi:hypothetical protein